ncbi:MAG: hypothetical protein PQJ49_05065 [Sphaerochaetaceae bacterium]|nr:hypothetical protein [Sphaerochaetaceae bacterium]
MVEESLKDLILIASILSTIISSYYALKYKANKSLEDTKINASNFKDFKEFVHKELEDLKVNIGDLLKKEDAENKYLTRKEHKLSFENLNMKIDLILDAVKNKHKG